MNVKSQNSSKGLSNITKRSKQEGKETERDIKYAE